MPNSIHLIFENNEKIISIDANTAKYLELVSSIRSIKSVNNLFGILNYTKTKIGCRTLRTNILQPVYGNFFLFIKYFIEMSFKYSILKISMQ
jgi:DNA mismatch repair protein MSH4